jgi:prepilin-type N-terminal cleavage/methylation domain-containing protein
MKNLKQNGFTLIELLISISLIIILLGVMIPAITKIQESGKKTMAEGEAAALQSAIKSYQTRYGMYPVETPNNLSYYSETGDEVLDPEDGWELLENIADKNDKGVFLLELENYRKGDRGEVLDPYGNPYMFLMDVHNDAGEYMADGKAKVSINSFEGLKKNEMYKITDFSVPGGVKVIFFTGSHMGKIDD